MTTITIGWTIHPESREGLDYWPFVDIYRPGQPQHTVTFDIIGNDLTGTALADAAFVATNTPDEGRLAGTEALILKAVRATGYRGREAHWSLSVGDTVTVDGRVYACASVGWEEIAA